MVLWCPALVGQDPRALRPTPLPGDAAPIGSCVSSIALLAPDRLATRSRFHRRGAARAAAVGILTSVIALLNDLGAREGLAQYRRASLSVGNALGKEAGEFASNSVGLSDHEVPA